MKQISLSQLRDRISNNGDYIRWAGTTASGTFAVKLVRKDGTTDMLASDPMSWRPTGTVTKVLRFVEADPCITEYIDISPPDDLQFKLSRRASVFGVNIGGDAMPGACKIGLEVLGCVLSYDIETSMKGIEPGAFGLNDVEILSIAAACTCGEEFYTSRCVEAPTSKSMVSRLLRYILQHDPLWLIGWNCYTFDNECMRYHADDSFKKVFTVVKVGGFGGASYGSIINIPGVYNVDPLVYMMKAPHYGLASYSLASVASTMGTIPKLPMPNMREDVSDQTLRTYNMNDCSVVLAIWQKQNFGILFPSLAVLAALPVYDCCRYITGTMAALAYSSFALSRNIRISWGTCTIPKGYKGGLVLSPIRGVHNNIVVCDFKSMYPTIMATCNIDPHNFTIESATEDPLTEAVRVYKNDIVVTAAGVRARFSRGTTGLLAELSTMLIQRRDALRKTSPMHALTIKIVGNSSYGAVGYENSPLYSPTCAAAITAIGRFCLRRSREAFKAQGLCVTYGDTDSCMPSGSGTKADVFARTELALKDIHEYMQSNILDMMKMELEAYYPRGIMLDKKRYCLLREDGTIKYTGVSLARRDTSGLDRAAAEVTISAILKNSRQVAIDKIAAFLNVISHMGMQGKFTLSDVSRYVKRNGRKGYLYNDNSEKQRFVSEEDANPTAYVRCDVGYVLRSVSTEIERFTVPAGMGPVSEVVSSSSYVF
jgi:DNA polymerase elongation subunit (family B)